MVASAGEFDKILAKVGECGKYQIVMYILLGLVGIPTGWQNLAMFFIGGQQDHWCTERTFASEGMSLFVTNSTPIAERERIKHCTYVDWNATSTFAYNASDIGSDAGVPLKKCDAWTFATTEYTSTIRSQWNLVCDNDYLVAMASTIYMAGFLTGALCFGSLSDIIGRKKTLMISLATEITAALAAAVASRYGPYPLFVVLRFVVGNAAGGSFTVAFVIVMEIFGEAKRIHFGIFMQGWFALGFLSEAGIAFSVRDHFYLQLALALPVIIFMIHFWALSESPRWLFAENRKEDAEPILRKMARWNGKELPDTMFMFKEPLHESPAKATLLDVFRRPRMRFRILITFFVWFVNSLVYYGISYNADKMPGNVYMNVAINAAVEVPAYVVTCLFMNRIGRRWMLAIAMVGGGASLVGIIPILDRPDLLWLVIVLANLGKFAISSSFAVIYVFTAEMFPTVVRNAAVGSCSMSARIGGLLAPQIVRLDKIVWTGFPALSMGILAVLGGLLSLLLPETTGERLPENLEDGEAFGTEDYKSAYTTNGTSQPNNEDHILLVKTDEKGVVQNGVVLMETKLI